MSALAQSSISPSPRTDLMDGYSVRRPKVRSASATQKPDKRPSMLARVHQDCQKCTPQIHLLPLVTHPTHTPPPETVRTLKPAVARQVVKWNERTKSYDHFPE